MRIGDQTYGSVQGASPPGPIWVDSMQAALRDVPADDFTAPDMGRFGGGFTPACARPWTRRPARRDVEYEYWYEDEDGNLYPEDDYYRGDPRREGEDGAAATDHERPWPFFPPPPPPPFPPSPPPAPPFGEGHGRRGRG